MVRRSTLSSADFGGGFAPPPRDLATILGVLFATYLLSRFETTAIVPALLSLGPAVTRGLLWQLVTYAFVGTPPGTWLIFSLLFLYFFGRDVFAQLGRRRFWTVLLAAVFSGGVVATLVYLLLAARGWLSPFAFVMLSGQSVVLTVFVTAFSVIFSHATILLFFVLPIRASWFVPVEILLAFVSFLDTRDLPGFCGILAVIATTYVMVSGRGPARLLRELRLRIEQAILTLRLRWWQRRRGLRVVRGGQGGGRGNGRANGAANGGSGGDVHRGPWVH